VTDHLVPLGRIVLVLAAVLSAVLAGTSPAGASNRSGPQARVDAYLAQTGGTQVAANEIALPSGAILTLATPGQVAPDTLACPHLYFCAYSGTNYTGDVISAFTCRKEVFIPFNFGSWVNNQSQGTQAKFEDSTHRVFYTTPPAFSARASQDWTHVWWVVPC